jgi:hypothetical protein
MRLLLSRCERCGSRLRRSVSHIVAQQKRETLYSLKRSAGNSYFRLRDGAIFKP